MNRRALLLAVGLLASVAASPVAAAGKPRVPAGRDPGGVAVAVIGPGVNYTLPQLAGRLARDGEGELIGWDFIDGDHLPLQRPMEGAAPRELDGTAVGAVILREAGGSRLVVVRDKPGDGLAHGKAAVLVARSPAKVVLVASRGTTSVEWEPFRQAASHFPHMLFIVPAGDDGVDLDRAPTYPAELGLANVIVVTAADENGWLTARANSGARTVDVAVAAAAVETIDGAGRAIRASGTVIASARLAAMAARLLAVEPGLAGTQLKSRLLRFAKPAPAGTRAVTRAGSIVDPSRPMRLE